jgi:hypothetical protein
MPLYHDEDFTFMDAWISDWAAGIHDLLDESVSSNVSRTHSRRAFNGEQSFIDLEVRACMPLREIARRFFDGLWKELRYLGSNIKLVCHSFH